MKIRHVFKSLTLLLVVLSFASCKNDAEYEKRYPLGKAEIRAIGEIASAACDSPIFVGYEKGFFADEGIDLHLVSGDLEVTKAGLQNNRFGVATESIGFLISIEQGLDIKVVAGTHKGCVRLLTGKDSPIKSPADLKGKKIGVETIGDADMIYVSVVLKKYGVDPKKDVEFVVYPADTFPLVYEKGEIDAFASWDPFAILTQETGNYKVISDIATDPVLNDAYCCFLYSPSKLLKEKPALIGGLVKAYRQGADWIAKHPDESGDLVIEKKYIAADNRSIISNLFRDYTYDAHKYNGNKKTNAREDLIFWVSEIKDLGYLSQDLDVEKFVADHYVDVLKNEE
jgi:NitT/TauT family transport system substrate-binding protein